MGAGIEVSNVEFTGDEHGGGTFSGFEEVFGVDAGIALSSGSVAGDEDLFYTSNLYGPNESDGVSASFGTPGDPDLDELVAPNVTQDATVLEFDFVADGPDISFRYIFGSEEYLEFVGSQFNDVFAFYVDGENCALVPDPKGGPDPVPVTINTINNDANSDLFQSNSLSEGDPTPFNTELDGFTVALTCATTVTVGEPHHLKLAIADTSDGSLDSTVLIAAGTLQVNEPPVADDQAVQTAPDTAVNVTLTASDANGDPLTYAVVDDPANGTLTGAEPDLVYTPDDGFLGEDTFTFTASDGVFTSEPATVTVNVTDQTPTPTPTTPPPTDPPTTEPPTTDPTPTGTLPGTGPSESTPWLAASALGLIGLGAAVLLVARRRLRSV